MAYVRRLPVDELKIDRSFILGMTDDDNDAILVRSAIDLGHNLGLTVVAEGVERADHVLALRRLGCDTAQGYHYARPMPAAGLAAWVRSRAESPLLHDEPAGGRGSGHLLDRLAGRIVRRRYARRILASARQR